MTVKRPPRVFPFATCINVVDGDTIDIELDLGFTVKVKDRFRLALINAPEVGKPGAAEATQYLKDTILGKPVLVFSTKIDKYGRYLAEIYLQENEIISSSINQRMLSLGLAVPYVG